MRLILALIAVLPLAAHDARGRTSAPVESRRLKNPLESNEARLFSAQSNYTRLCAACHGEDGKARTRVAGAMPSRPTDLTNYFMQGMKDGEIYWVVSNGVAAKGMPAFAESLNETQRWELVLWVRELRKRQLYHERIELGSYDWKLPPGFPYPNVPSDNLMTAEKVELGRHLFYDKRLSLNQTQSCATCHQQSRAFTDGRPRGAGSTGELHARGPMSLVNIAYAPVLTWANPNVKRLEQQALVPLFGDHPIELGFAGKEDELLRRLKADPRYRKLFANAFSGEEPVTIANLTRAIASFERTLLSGDSPYDEYRRGDDPGAISESAKRGESLFFSERLECFHCHGGFNFTGTVDYLGKGTPEVEFHNTGLYNLKGKLSYPPSNNGLYEFTQQPEDSGKFKAPTLRNIALTAPYMHDGSIKTLEEAIEHYRAGGRTVKTGPLAGIGFDNPNKSEFVKSFTLSPQEKQDLLGFLRSLTDPSIATDTRWSDPWLPVSLKPAPLISKHTLRGEVIAVYPEDGSIKVSHREVPGLLTQSTREFLVSDLGSLASLKPGAKIAAGVRKRGGDFVLDGIRPASSAP